MRIIDSHTHLEFNDAAKLIANAESFGYDKICILGIPCCGNKIQNIQCMSAKRMRPDYVFVYGGMVYSDNVMPSGTEHLKQLEAMTEAGFDGWKLLESKPSVYSKLRIPLDSEVFDYAFAFAEENGIPITWHAGDPATFWDEKTAPEFAVRNHWLCVGEGYPQLNEIYRQVETVLKRHPKLRATLAHMYFTSDNRPHAERLLSEYENLKFDLTPGSEMYGDFMADRDGWSRFFERFQDKLVYGSDMTEDMNDIVFGSQKNIVDLALKTLTDDEYFMVQWFKGNGLKLPDAILEKLLYKNFKSVVGDIPKPMNESGLEKYKKLVEEYC